MIPSRPFSAALAELGGTGRAIAAFATPIGEPVYVPQARRHEPAAPVIITINIITAQEEPLWPIQ